MNCEKCRIGHYRPVSVPFIRWLDDQIMIVPDVPARACDVCGTTVYNDDFMDNLRFLLDHLIDDAPSGSRTRQTTLQEELFGGWQPNRRNE